MATEKHTEEPGLVQEDVADAPMVEEEAPFVLENLCILPPRQKTPVSKEQEAKDAILLPPISPTESVSSIYAALGEIKGYAHITNYHLVVEQLDEGFIEMVRAETAKKMETTKGEDYEWLISSSNKKTKHASSGENVISPYTRQGACIEMSPSVECSTSHSEEIVLNDYEDLSMLVEEGVLQSNMGLRMVLLKYDLGKIKIHVDKTRLLFYGNVPVVAGIAGAGNKEQADDDEQSGNKINPEGNMNDGDTNDAKAKNEDTELDLSEMNIPIFTNEKKVLMDGTNYKDFFHLVFGDEEGCPTLKKGKMVDPEKSKSRMLAEKKMVIDELCRLNCSISYGGFNPPNSQRRAAGDLVYLEVILPDGKIVHVTGISSGFFVNKSKGSGPRTLFNPLPEEIPHFSHTLLDCLVSWSASLRSSWQTALMAALERSKLNSQSSDPLQAVCDATFQGVEAAKKGNTSLIDSVSLCPSWLVPEQNKTDTDSIFEYNLGKSELSCIEDSFGLDIRGGAPRDWNEELQGAREMARDTLDQRIERARLIYRTFVDFGHAAFAGVMAICNGQIRALNPNEPPRNHVYLFNNIFFSRAADAGMDTFKVYSGDQAARKAASRDARCVGILNRMDIEGLNTLATTLIDYLGSRFVCQSVVPGILLGDKTHKVLYGSVESSNPLSWDKDFHHKLESNLGDVLMIATRKMKKQPLDQGETVLSETDSSADENVTSSSDELIDVFGSIEMKGIQGSDQRTYCLDISRLTPRDANWVCKDKGGTGKFESVAPEKPLDIPVSLDDDEWIMAVLRPELITRYVQKKGKEHVASIRAKEEESKSGDEKVSSNGSASENETELSEEEKEKVESERNAKAEEHEKIYLNYIKQFKMNLNVFLPRVKAIDESDANAKTQLENDMKRITDISNYLWDEVLPVITHEVKENADSIPVDGKGLSDLLHRNGVNCRYLGRLATLAIEEEQKDLKDSEQYILDLKAGKKTTCSRYSMSPCWLELLETEMVARAAKHVLDRYWNENLGIARTQSSKMVAAFLSALVSESEESAAETDRRINSKSLGESANDDLAYRWPVQNEVEIRGRGEVWSDISKEVGKRFRYSLHLYNTHGKNSSRTPYGALLRRVCERIGVRLYAKAYSLGSKCLCSTENSFPISASDIAGILPMMKHAATEDSSSFLPCNHGADAANALLHVSLTDAKLLLNNAKAFQRAQSLQMALELSQEASQLYQRVTDTPLHSKISECANLIANILFQAQETDLACVHATKATALTIQTGGFDTVDVISAVMTLSHTLLNSGQVPEAIKQMRSLIYLVEMISGPNHAVLSSLYSRLGAVYSQLGVPQVALSFMQVSAIYKATNDKISQAQSYRQIAELSMKCGMHKQAVEAAKVAHNLFFMVLGPDHDVTKTLGVELQFYVKEGAKEETKEQAEMEMQIQIEKANRLADEIIAQVENEEKSKTKKKKKKKKKN